MLNYKQKQKQPLLLFILFFVIAALTLSVFAGYSLGTKKNQQIESKSELLAIPELKKEVTLTGTVKAIDDSCNHDGVCKVKVDMFWITTDLGGDPAPQMVISRGPKGRILQLDGSIINVSKDLLDMQVEVFAKVLDDSSLSLYGNSEYYLKIIAPIEKDL